MSLSWIGFLWGISIVVVFLLTWPFLTKQRVDNLEKEVIKALVDDEEKNINADMFCEKKLHEKILRDEKGEHLV